MKHVKNTSFYHPEQSKEAQSFLISITQSLNMDSSGCTKSRLAVIFLSAFISFTALAQDAQTLINIANNAYNEGMYDSALNVYHQVEKQNLASGQLYYNMGNAYFKKNDIASAILYYEKAKKLDPNDEDIEYNLHIANSLIVDKIERVPELFYKRWWNYFYNMFNADTWTIISIISWFALIFFVVLFILSKSRGYRKLSFYLGLLFLFTSIATFGLASQKYYYGKEQNEAIIFTPTITVKSSPTLNAVDLFVVHEGTKIYLLDEVQGWVKIRIPNGSIGWLPLNSIKKI